MARSVEGPPEQQRRRGRISRSARLEDEGANPLVEEVASSPGRRLDPLTRIYFERRFSANFNEVRVHDDARASRSAQHLHAQAYATGNSVVFGSGRYRPSTGVGRSLLAHELAHVAQQRRAVPTGPMEEAPSVGPVHARSEAAARGAERGGAGPTPVQGSGAPAASIQRRSIWEGIAGLFHGDDFPEADLIAYLESLDRTGAIEDYTESDNKARVVVRHWKRGDSRFLLTRTRKILLIREMLSGFTGDDDEQAILDLLTGTGGPEFDSIVSAVGVSTLDSAFQGAEQTALDALLSARRGQSARTRSTETDGESSEGRRPQAGSDVFSAEKALELQQRFTSNAESTNRLNCILIVRDIAPRLFADDPELAERVRERLGRLRGRNLTMPDLGEAMSELGLASEHRPIPFDNGNGSTQPTAMESSAWAAIMEMVGTTPGWHIFGMAVFNGYHSVTVLVDNRPDGPRLYWADQWRIDPGEDFNQEGGSASGFRRYEQAGFDGFINAKTAEWWQHVFETKGKRYNATLHIWKFRSGLETAADRGRSSDHAERPVRRRATDSAGPVLPRFLTSDARSAAASRGVRSAGRPLDEALMADLGRFIGAEDVSAEGEGQQEQAADAVEQRVLRGRPGDTGYGDRSGSRRPSGIGSIGVTDRWSEVRVHTDAGADRSTTAMAADAYTVGRDVAFGRGNFSPRSRSGRALLAHELTHVAQDRGGADRAPQRRLTDEYQAIEDRLSYGLFDWAITDHEAHEVLELLSNLSDSDLADTVAAMDRDGLVDRLLDNVAVEDSQRYAVLIGRVTRRRSVTRSARRVNDRLSYGVFDWVITDRDARQAFQTLMGLESQQLRTVVANMVNAGTFDRLMENLPQEDHERYAAFIERIRRIGEEFRALVSAQAAFLRSRPGGAGRTVRKRVDETGYGGSRSTWQDLDRETRLNWRNRARLAIAAVTLSVQGTELEAILDRSELVFRPVDTERNNAYAYVSGGNKLYFGRGWVEDAEENVHNVWQSIAHELGGHEEFGSTWSWEIMQGTMAQLTRAERREALGSNNRVFSAYGYLETEIYAELREVPHRLETSGGDRPEIDVRKQLRRMRGAFGPEVAGQIAMRLYYRVMDDPRITTEARRLLHDAIQEELALFPIRASVLP